MDARRDVKELHAPIHQGYQPQHSNPTFNIQHRPTTSNTAIAPSFDNHFSTKAGELKDRLGDT
jgi:hypothetical protein